ncbi:MULTISPECIES: AAA domain-containing protein [unclassified Actinomadura]|uniref:AAA domain-containing protein n=1 Tax=unclassified Actinomadura TaxID=2626254 RepID=UPI0011F05511|nr:AAA domain-containing protein [Actinomadura sp. K4S16]
MNPGDDVDRLVHYLCVDPATAKYGPFRLSPGGLEGTDLIAGRLRRYRLVDGQGRPADLHVYAGLVGVGGLLWEQEVRVLLRLGASALPALPQFLDGGYEEPESTAKAGVGTKGIALVATRGSDHTLADAGAADAMRADPMFAVMQFMRLAEALMELHDLGVQHRCLGPSSILADLSGDRPSLWIARFEMSSLIGNLLRRTLDSDVDLPELRALFVGDGTEPDLRMLACQPPERLSFLYPDGDPAPMLEEFTSDVFSLAATVWDWFCDPALLTAEPLPEPVRARHAELNRRMVDALDSRLPGRLAKLLAAMLDPDPRARPTAADVHLRLWEDLDALRRSLADGYQDKPFLIVDNPKEAATNLKQWRWITHGADTDQGREEIAAFMADELANAQLLHSPLGAAPFVRGGDPQDKRNSHTVLLGRQAAWFCQPYRRKTWGGFGDPLDEALIIKYVAQRESGAARRALDDLVQSAVLIDVPAVDIVAINVADAVMDAALAGRPSWRPLRDQLSPASSEAAEDQEYGNALDLLLRYQGVELQARTYAFAKGETNGGQVTVDWEPEREKKLIYNDSLLTKFADSPWLRPSLGDFFQHLEDDEGEALVEIGEDIDGRASFPPERSVWTIVQERAGDDRVILRRSAQGTGHMPERGWIRPLSDTGTRTALTRQALARLDLVRARGLLAQLRDPRSIKTLPHRWRTAGARLEGEDGPAIVRDMLSYRPFYAVQGPPGTGKTTVVAEAVAAYLKAEPASRVLVSAQSGFALDNLAQRILTRMGELDQDGRPTERMDVPALRITSHSGTPPNTQIRPWTREMLAVRLARRVRERVDEVLGGRLRNRELQDVLVRWRGLLDERSGENVLPELGDRLERAANLVFATCATATEEAVMPGGTRSRFEWVIVEEAAKAWPTELAMPLACGTAWTLIGDHRQLGAHRRSDFERFLADCAGDPSPELAALGEQRGLYLDAFDTFRRLFRVLENPATTVKEQERLPLRRLVTQFRMRKPIAEVVSRVFYPASDRIMPDGLPPGRLRTGRSVPPLPIRVPYTLAGESVVWLDTDGVPDCSDMPRWTNAGEARLAAALVERLDPPPVPNQHGYGTHPLAVLTPYRQQTKLLKQYDVLRDHVSTIHAFQGREADIVIVSLVRDQRHGPPGVPWSSLGHLTQQNLINVMMSRARGLLVIIGNHRHFAEVDRNAYRTAGDEEQNPFWGRLCTAVRLYGTVLPAAEAVTS